MREPEAPVLVSGAAGKRYRIIEGILEGAAGIIAESGGVIERPVAAPLKQDAGINFVYERRGRLTGRSLEAVAVGKTITQMGLDGERPPPEHRGHRREGGGGGWRQLAGAGEPWGGRGFVGRRRQGRRQIGFEQLGGDGRGGVLE